MTAGRDTSLRAAWPLGPSVLAAGGGAGGRTDVQLHLTSSSSQACRPDRRPQQSVTMITTVQLADRCGLSMTVKLHFFAALFVTAVMIAGLDTAHGAEVPVTQPQRLSAEAQRGKAAFE